MYGEHKIIMKYYSVFGIFIVIIKMQSALVYLVEKLPWLIYEAFLLRDIHNFNAYLYFLFIMTILKNLSLRFCAIWTNFTFIYLMEQILVWTLNVITNVLYFHIIVWSFIKSVDTYGPIFSPSYPLIRDSHSSSRINLDPDYSQRMFFTKF